MIVIGIDPGYAIVGYGVVKYEGNKFTVLDYGAVTTEAHTDMNVRFEIIYDRLSEVFAKYKPKIIGVEELFFNNNAKTVIAVAEARGIILLAAQKSGALVSEFTPLQIKQSVTGYGRAVKSQVQEMTKLILNLRTVPKPDDVADALAVAICTAHSSGSIMRGLV